MRPTKLVICAFGSYSHEVVIDMESLGERGIYLITGENGAGKTNIFDAIVFALYGKTSSDKRESKILRSQYARSDMPTYVELEFVYGKNIYKIRRTLGYSRPAKRGHGTVEEAEKVVMTLPDGTILDNSTRVKETVHNLIGLNRDQFMQVAMIAQGSFQKLLTGNTLERTKILNEIFKTSPYKKLQDQLKAEADLLEKKYEVITSRIGQYCRSVKYDAGDPCAEPVEAVLTNNAAINARIDEVVDAINRITGKYDALIRRLKDSVIQKRMELLDRIILLTGKTQSIISTKGKIAKSRQFVESKTAELNRLKEERDRAAKTEPEIELLKGNITLLTKTLDSYTAIDTQSAIKEKAELNQSKLQEELEKRKEYETKLVNTIAKDKDAIKQIDLSLERESSALLKQTQAVATLGKISSLDRERTTLESLAKQLSAQQAVYRVASDKYQAKASEAMERENAFFDGQAGLLAAKLVHGSPCPVCGSLDHPSPAPKAPEVPSEEELNTLKSQAEQLRTARDQAGQTAHGLCIQEKAKRDDIHKTACSILGECQWEEAASLLAVKRAEVEQDVSTFKSILDECDREKSDKAARGKAVEKNQTELDKLRAAIETIKTQIADYELVKNGADKVLESLRSQPHAYESRQAAEEQINNLNTKKDELQEALATAQNNYNALKSKISEHQIQIETLEEEISNSERIFDIADLNNRHARLKTQQANSQLALDSLNTRSSSNKEIIENILSCQEELRKLEPRYRWMKNLSDTANGTLPGKEQLSLETYILMTFFERIVHRANIRFLTMSQGQYELKRHEETGVGRAKTGLGLAVVDHSNGSERSAASLSGGESFMASLALALGLADEVQATAGNIRLDSMFIDEGFGSLSNEARETCVKLLKGLSEGKRLVGIISHVSELQSSIERQVVVTKENPNGSRVRIV